MIRISQFSFLILLLLLNLVITPAWSQDSPTSLQILIVEGEGAINNIKQRVNREPIVQVEDENHRPVAGAAVVFFLPNGGPGGTFANGVSTFTTTTNAQGQATARGIRFNPQSGSMQIRVTASLGGRSATAVISQTNVAGVAGAATTAGMSAATKWLIIIGIAGAGAVAGGIALSHGGGGGSSNPSSPTVTITPGTPTVGAPQQ